MNVNKEPDKSFSDRCITLFIHVLAFCGIFLLLMIISHAVIASEIGNNKTGIAADFKEQITVAVFEDHNEQVESSMPYGLSWKLVERAAEQQNLDLIKIATTWQSGINRLKDNRLDLMFAAFKNEERKVWAQFSLPLVSDSSVLLSYIDSPINALEDVDFEHEVVGVVSNSTQETLARKIGFKHIYPAKVRKRLHKLLESGRINYVLLGHSSIALYCKQEKPCVQQVGAALADNYTRVMGLKNTARASEIMKKLNLGFRTIYSQKATLELFLEHGFSETYYHSWKSKLENEVNELTSVTALR